MPPRCETAERRGTRRRARTRALNRPCTKMSSFHACTLTPAPARAHACAPDHRYDSTLIPVDHNGGKNQIIDDEMDALLVEPARAAGAKLTAVVDACHSGTVLDLPFLCRGADPAGNWLWVTEDARSLAVRSRVPKCLRARARERGGEHMPAVRAIASLSLRARHFLCTHTGKCARARGPSHRRR